MVASLPLYCLKTPPLSFGSAGNTISTQRCAFVAPEAGGMVVDATNTPMIVRGIATLQRPELDRRQLGRHFVVQAGGVLLLENLKLTHGYVKTDGTNEDWGGSVQIYRFGKATFFHVSFEHNTIVDLVAPFANFGGAVGIYDGTAIFVDCDFFHNAD